MSAARLAEVWAHREEVELEAADQLARLAVDLRAAGAPAELAERAAAAADDERDHAVRCRRIVEHLAPEVAQATSPAPRIGGVLGPPELPVERRALYASVALCCVTETLSTALLLEMRRHATDALVRTTVQRILRDEIGHSRLGWAHLAWAAARGDVGWLAPHVGPMIRAAIATDLPPAAAAATIDHPGDPVGILSARRIRDVARRALDDVVLPGLARFGVAVAASALLAVGGLATAGCDGSAPAAGDPQPDAGDLDTTGDVSFSRDVVPVLIERCTRCHRGSARGDFRTAETAHAALTGPVRQLATGLECSGSAARELVVPGDPDASVLWQLVGVGFDPETGECPGSYGMPRGDPRGILIDIDPDGAAAIRRWIELGARDD